MSVIHVPKSLQEVIRVLNLKDKEPMWKIEDFENRTVVTLTWLKNTSSRYNPDSVDFENNLSAELKSNRLNGDESEDTMDESNGDISGEIFPQYLENQSEPLNDYLGPSRNKNEKVESSKESYIFSKDDKRSQYDHSYNEANVESVFGEAKSPRSNQIEDKKRERIPERVEKSTAYITGLDECTVPFSFKDESYNQANDESVLGDVRSPDSGNNKNGSKDKKIPERIEKSRAYITGLDECNLPFSFNEYNENTEHSSTDIGETNAPMSVVKKSTYLTGDGDSSFNFTFNGNNDDSQEDNKIYDGSDVTSSPELDEEWLNAPSPDAYEYDGDEEQEIEVGTSGRTFDNVQEQESNTRESRDGFDQNELGNDGLFHMNMRSVVEEEDSRDESNVFQGGKTGSKYEVGGGLHYDADEALSMEHVKYLRPEGVEGNFRRESSTRVGLPVMCHLASCDDASTESEVLTPVDRVVHEYVDRNSGTSIEMNNHETESTKSELFTPTDSAIQQYEHRNNGMGNHESTRSWNKNSPRSNERRQREINFAERFRGEVFPSEVVSGSSQVKAINNGLIKCSCDECFTVRAEAIRHILFNCPMDLCLRIDLDIRIHQEIKQWEKEEEEIVGRKWWQAFKTKGEENYGIILAEEKRVILKQMIDQFLKQVSSRKICCKDGSEVVLVEEFGMTLHE